MEQVTLHPPEGGRRRSRRRLAFRVVAVVLALALALALGELTVRLTRTYWNPTTERAEYLQYQPSIFTRNILEPGQRFHQENGDLTINNLGYRGRDFSVQKPPGTLRIVFMGGSFVFSWPPQTGMPWTERTEKRLWDAGFKQVEIINAGIPSHATFDALGRFYSEIWRFQPDYVVLCCAWNDVKYFADLGDGVSLLRDFKPYVRRYDPRTDYRNFLDRFLSEHSQLFVRIRQSFISKTLNAEEEGMVPDKPTIDRVPPEGLAQYRLTLRLFVDAVRDAGSTPILMTEPTLATPDASEADRKRVRTEMVRMTYPATEQALEACRRILMEVATEKQALVIDSFATLTGKSELFRDHVHMTSDGYEALSKLVAEAMEKILRARPDAPAALPTATPTAPRIGKEDDASTQSMTRPH